ncbi:MAG: hypothetical protein H6970_06015 [Gammaproteobacteria bacterium]|nr:hypothetical protein [Gammaproteobacteria bacterium]MCP5424607.1 hypothetical protein [Gammaproteobacteria bacterium]
MSELALNSNVKEDSAMKRKPYHAPVLLKYGRLIELTQTGTGGKQENNQGQGQPNRRL